MLPCLFFVLSAAFFGAAQEPPTGAPAGSDPEALALFQQVARAQLVAGKPSPVQGFSLKLTVRNRSEGSQDVDIFLAYRQDPKNEYLKVSFQDNQRGTRVEQGFDGRRYWLLDEDKKFQDLSAHAYARDRERIDDSLDLCAELLLLLDLQSLQHRARELEIWTGEYGGRALRGVLPRRSERWVFVLHLDKAEQQALALDLIPPAPPLLQSQDGEAQSQSEPPSANAENAENRLERYLPRRFELRYPKAFEGRLVPREIREFTGEERQYPSRILELHRFHWQSPPPLESFQGRPKNSKPDSRD
ncbi:MAG: hypothetical protein DWQ01_13500 [Planctomycetota bacterium]|nr:MAG: hypothetical protein DWQ01_13500 [Planctomycetota bacterium]